MNHSTYVFVLVKGFFLERNFYIECKDEFMSARDQFKIIDNYKKTLGEEEQLRINLHVWGQEEFNMLSSAGIAVMKVKNAEDAITQIKTLLG